MLLKTLVMVHMSSVGYTDKDLGLYDFFKDMHCTAHNRTYLPLNSAEERHRTLKVHILELKCFYKYYFSVLKF